MQETASATIASQNAQLHTQSVQYRNAADEYARQRKETTENAILNGIKLTQSAISSDLNDLYDKFQNELAEEESKGTFDYVDMNSENGTEYDAEKVISNRQKWADEWVKKNGGIYNSVDRVSKGVNSILNGTKATVIENVNTRNYNKLQETLSSSTDYMTSPYYDPENLKSIRSKIVTAETAEGRDTDWISDDTNSVENFIINQMAYGKDWENYNLSQYAKEYETAFKNSDFTEMDEALFKMNLALDAKNCGESEEHFKARMADNYESLWKDYNQGQFIRGDVIGSNIDDSTKGVEATFYSTGGDSNALVQMSTDFESRLRANGYTNINGEKVTPDKISEEDISTMVSEWTDMAKIIWNNCSSAQTQLLQKATDAVNGAYPEGLPFTSVSDYVDALRTESEVNADYAKANVTEDLKSTFNTNALNEKKASYIEQYVTTNDTESLIKLYTSLHDDGLLPWAAYTMGWGDITKKSDDDPDNEYMVKFNQLKEGETLSARDMGLILFGGSSSVAKSSSKSTSVAASSTDKGTTAYYTGTYETERVRDSISADVGTIASTAAKALTDGEGKTYTDYMSEAGYDEKTSSEFGRVVDLVQEDSDYMAVIQNDESKSGEILTLVWKLNYGTDSEKTVAQTKLETLKMQGQALNGNTEAITQAKIALYGNDKQKAEAEQWFEDNQMLSLYEEITGDTDLNAELKKKGFNRDGSINDKGFTSTLTGWNGGTTPLTTTYQATTGKEAAAESKAHAIEKNEESYWAAVQKGATQGTEGVKAALEEAGFDPEDKTYESLYKVWDDYDDDDVLMRAISSDTETAKTVVNAMATISDKDSTETEKTEAANVISEIRLAQAFNENNEEVINNFDILLDNKSHTDEEYAAMEKWTVDNGYAELLRTTFGLNDLANPNDDDKNNKYRKAYESIKSEAVLNDEIFGLEEKKNAIIDILSKENIALQESRAITPSQIQEEGAKYYTGKNTKAFIDDAVSLFAEGNDYASVQAELERKYDTKWNSKLYDKYLKFFEAYPDLGKALAGADNATKSSIAASIAISVNDNENGSTYSYAADSLITKTIQKYQNRMENEANNKELAPLFDPDATAEEKTKATQYMNANAFQAFVNNETVQAFVKDYIENNEGATVLDALNAVTEDINPSSIDGGFTFYNDKTGFQKGVTSNDNLYKWSLSAEWQDAQKQKEIEAGRPAAQETLMAALSSNGEYSTEIASSLANYPTYQAVYNAVVGGNGTFDEQTRVALKAACQKSPEIAQEIYNYTNIYLNGKTEEKAKAEKKLKSISGTTAFEENSAMIKLGYVCSNPYNDSNKKGYDDLFAEELIHNTIITKEGISGAEIAGNLISLTQQIESYGIKVPDDVKARIKSYSPEDYEKMTDDTLMSTFSDLIELTKDTATNAYNTWNSFFGDATYYGQGDSTVAAVIKSEVDNESKKLGNAICVQAYQSKLVEFGEDYHGYHPTKDLVKQGDDKSLNYYSVMLEISTISDKAEREKVIDSYSNMLTKDARTKLKGLTTVDMVVGGQQIKGLEDYNFLNRTKALINGSAAFKIIDKDPTDFMKYAAGNEYLVDMVQSAVAEYKKDGNLDKLNDTLEKCEQKAVNGYMQYVNAGTGSMENYITEVFNPDVNDFEKSSNGADEAERGVNFFSLWNQARETHQKSAFCDTFEVDGNMNKLIEGKELSSTATACVQKLVDTSIDSDSIITVSASLALSLMGYAPVLTEKDFSKENIGTTQTKLYSIMKKLDDGELSQLYDLTTAIDRYYSTDREVKGLGYTSDYILDTSGKVTFTDGSTAEKNKSGSWIRTYPKTNENSSQKDVNITITSNSTPIGTKVQYLFGETNDVRASANGISASFTWVPGSEQKVTSTIKGYNTEKDNQYEPADYSTASEIIATKEYQNFMYEDPANRQGVPDEVLGMDWTMKEMTGEAILAEYCNLTYSGTESDMAEAERLLSQCSDGMKSYVEEKEEQRWVELGLNLLIEQDRSLDDSFLSRFKKYLATDSIGGKVASAFVPSALETSDDKLGMAIGLAYNNPNANIPEAVKEKAKEKLVHYMAEKNIEIPKSAQSFFCSTGTDLNMEADPANDTPENRGVVRDIVERLAKEKDPTKGLVISGGNVSSNEREELKKKVQNGGNQETL